MDQPYHMEKSVGDYLHQNRSITLSLNEPRLDTQNITEATIESTSTGHTPSSTGFPSVSTNFTSESEGSPYLAGPPKHFSQRPHSAQNVVDQSWSYLGSSRTVDSPIPILKEIQSSVSAPENSTQASLTFSQDEMSTLGVQFDAHFDPVARASYTWPLFMNDQYGTQDMGALDTFNMPSTIPSYPKSLTSSPPPALLTPEQRELKRQRDLARRETKTKQRRDRATSNPYHSSQNSTPDLLPRTMSSYSSTMAPSSMTSENSPIFTSASYMPSLASQVSSSESPELYGAPFPLISNDFGVGGFLMPFSSTVEQSIPAYTSRPHSHSSASDQPYFYRTSPVTTQESQETVRVVHSRPKPQCWDHGCNGRQFSTFSNLLRHQREKSGISSKPSCPKCGAEFTRTTARNGHMAHEKCKQRRNSNH